MRSEACVLMLSVNISRKLAYKIYILCYNYIRNSGRALTSFAGGFLDSVCLARRNAERAGPSSHIVKER